MPGRKRAPVKRAATKPPAPAEQEQETPTEQEQAPVRTDRLGRPKRDRRARFN